MMAWSVKDAAGAAAEVLVEAGLGVGAQAKQGLSFRQLANEMDERQSGRWKVHELDCRPWLCGK
jgi:membrane-bound lytic murein transglycosylase B